MLTREMNVCLFKSIEVRAQQAHELRRSKKNDRNANPCIKTILQNSAFMHRDFNALMSTPCLGTLTLSSESCIACLCDPRNLWTDF